MPDNKTNKRIAKNTLMLYIRMLITMGISLYTSRIVLNTLGIENYGIYNVVGGIVALFGFLNSVLSVSTQRFLAFRLEENNVELQKTFSAAFILHILLSLTILVIGETIGLWFLRNKINIPTGRENAAFWAFEFSLLASMLAIIQVPFNATIIVHERMNIYAYVSIVEVSLKLIIVYLLTISNYDKLISYAILIFIVAIIVFIIYLLYCKKKFLECQFMLVSDIALYKSMWNFSGWMIFSNGAFILASQGINILLNIFFGPIVNAARGIAFQVHNALTAFVINFQVAVDPNIIKFYAADKKEIMFDLVFQNAKFAFCLMWLLAFPFLLRMEKVLNYWLINIPENTALFCRLVLIDSLIGSLDRPFAKIIHAMGKVKMPCIIGGIVYLCILPVSYFLLKVGFPAYIPFIV
ncbi:MAG: lipopolysaccharide biosynthesis protein, partial [Bacteroidales bacterium]|nr:lipopolysaccharide biosynthesis protein [Bacteroidales bacterium]